jgi:3-isopropylmalate dehydratase small subunit
VELKLEQVVPDQYKLHAHHWLILHGRYTCVARKPLCERCIIHDLWRQLHKQPGDAMTIDLPRQVVIAPDRSEHAFEISPLRKDRLMQGIDDIDVTLAYRKDIENFEARRRAAYPWLPTAQRE